jgi:hypothetical protein
VRAQLNQKYRLFKPGNTVVDLVRAIPSLCASSTADRNQQQHRTANALRTGLRAGLMVPGRRRPLLARRPRRRRRRHPRAAAPRRKHHPGQLPLARDSGRGARVRAGPAPRAPARGQRVAARRHRGRIVARQCQRGGGGGGGGTGRPFGARGAAGSGRRAGACGAGRRGGLRHGGGEPPRARRGRGKGRGRGAE